MESLAPAPAQDVIASPLARGFEAWFPPVADRAKTAIAEGLVVIDTNVLLNLYKYDPNVTQQWFKIFEKLGSRLWIPHQVLIEFWKNRDRLAGHPATTTKAASDIRKAHQNLVSTYVGWIRDRGLTQTEAQRTSIAHLSEAVNVLLDEIDAADNLHRERFDSDPAHDEVAKELARLTTLAVNPIGVGEPFDDATLQLEINRAKVRYAASIPPGYMDDDKNDRSTVGKSSDAKYGDYLLWRQTLAEAAARAAEGNPPWVVLVTDDAKEDWWRKFVSDDEDHRQVARPELVEEMFREAGAHYIQLTAASLLRYADALNVAVSADAIRSAETVTDSPEGEWFEEVLYLDVPRSNVRAKARLSRSDERVKVLRGSQARVEQTPTIPEYTKWRINQLLDEGTLAPDPTNEDAYVFTTDWIAKTTSASACVIRAASASGNASWRTEAGLNPSELRAARDEATTDSGIEAEE